MPFVVAINAFPDAPALPRRRAARGARPRPGVPIVECDARRRASSRGRPDDADALSARTGARPRLIPRVPRRPLPRHSLSTQTFHTTGAITVTTPPHPHAGTDEAALSPPPGLPGPRPGPRRPAPALRSRGGRGHRGRVREAARRTRPRRPRPDPRRRADVGGPRAQREPAHGPLDLPVQPRRAPLERRPRRQRRRPPPPRARYQLAADLQLRRGRRPPAAARRGHRGHGTIEARGLRRYINRASNSSWSTRSARSATADLVSQFAEHLPMR